MESANLELTAFFIVDVTGLARLLTIEAPVTSLIQRTAYETGRSQVATALSDAITEFGQIADAVIKTVKVYQDKDEIVEHDLDKIYTA